MIVRFLIPDISISLNFIESITSFASLFSCRLFSSLSLPDIKEISGILCLGVVDVDADCVGRSVWVGFLGGLVADF